VDCAVVKDGNLNTARGRDGLPAFTEHLPSSPGRSRGSSLHRLMAEDAGPLREDRAGSQFQAGVGSQLALLRWVRQGRLLPPSSTQDARRLLAGRAMRGFVDGAVSVLLASYLSTLGFSPLRIGALATGTMVGSAVLTLLVGLAGGGLDRRLILVASSVLMFATGLGFASFRGFAALMVVAVVGTLNPSSGDVSVFLPVEQAALSETVAARERTALFAWYNVAGAVAAALGSLASGIPVALGQRSGWTPAQSERSVFFFYAAIAIAIALVYLGLTPRPAVQLKRAPPLARSRRTVLKLVGLFSLDSFAGGFVLQALLVLWLYRRFDLSVQVAGAVFFGANLLGGLSQFGSSWLAGRLGLIRTMVFSHLPGNACLVLAALMPSAPLAVGFLLLRACMSQMDVPARQSFVMAIVPPEERTAASSVTNVPRSLAASASPLLAGALLGVSSFGWPLICAGVLKATYDLMLFWQFRSVKPGEGVS
jgi:MFS family permease